MRFGKFRSPNNWAFRTASLTPGQWGACVLIGAGSIPWQWVVIMAGKVLAPGMNDVDKASIAKQLETAKKDGASGLPNDPSGLLGRKMSGILDPSGMCSFVSVVFLILPKTQINHLHQLLHKLNKL